MNCIIFLFCWLLVHQQGRDIYCSIKENWSDLVCVSQTQRLAGVTPHPPPRSAPGGRWPRPCPWAPRRPAAGALWSGSCAWLTAAWWRYFRTLLTNEDRWRHMLPTCYPSYRWSQTIQVSWWRLTVPTSSALCCPHTGGVTRPCPLLLRCVSSHISVSEKHKQKEDV